MFLLPVSENIFQNFKVLCFWHLDPHFSDRYEQTETRCCVFCFRVYGLRLLFGGHAQTYIYICTDIYIYICFYCQFQKNNLFQVFKVLCFWHLDPHFFWQVRTNGNQVLCFLFQGLWFKVIAWRPCTYIYIYICVFIASFRKYFCLKFQSVVFLTFGPTLFLTDTN